jgi:hypothetical protein
VMSLVHDFQGKKVLKKSLKKKFGNNSEKKVGKKGRKKENILFQNIFRIPSVLSGIFYVPFILSTLGLSNCISFSFGPCFSSVLYFYG